jgi:hypothetical protein
LPLRLVAAHAWPSGGLIGDPGLGVDPRAVVRDVVVGHLATAAAGARQVAPELEIDQVEVTGYPVPVLLGESARAEIVVLGDRGLGGFTGLLIGSVAVEVTAHASCPVIVVRGSEPSRTGPDRTGPDRTASRAGGRRCRRLAHQRGGDGIRLRGGVLVGRPARGGAYVAVVDATMAPLLDWDVIDSDEREVLAERLAGWTEKYPDVPVRRLVARD